MNAEARYEVNGRIVIRRIAEEVLLVPISGPAAGACVYPVNPTALSVWECLAGGGTVSEAAAGLVERFGATPDQAIEDSAACAGAFVAESLLRERPA